MENKSHAFVAGIFTIVLLTATVLAAWWLHRDRVGQASYEIATNLAVPGLRPQGFVRFRGLNVGRVTHIAFNQEIPGQILIRIEINPETPVTESTFATLGHQGVTGIAFIELNDDGTRPNTRVVSTDEHLARIEMRPGLFSNLNDRALAVLEQIQGISTSLNTLFQPENQKAMIDAFKDLSAAAKGVEQVTKQLEPTLTQLPDLTTRMGQTMESFVILSRNMGDLSNTVNTFVSHSVEGETLPKVNLLVDNARTSMNTLNNTLDQINQQPSGLLFGTPSPAPGPGEAGFVSPGN